MGTMDIGIWVHVHLVVFSFLGEHVMAYNSSLTVTPSSEYSMYTLSAQTSIAMEMSTQPLETGSTRALITNHTVVSTSSSAILRTDISTVQTIQPTATMSGRDYVSVESSSISNIATSTGYVAPTSSVGGMITSLPLTSEQGIMGITESLTIPPGISSQTISSSLALNASVSTVSSVSSSEMNESFIAPSPVNQPVPNTQVTTLLDRHSTSMITPPLPSTTMFVSATEIINSAYQSKSVIASHMASIVVSSTSSLSPSSSSLVNVSSSSLVNLVNTSVVQSTNTSILKQTNSESATPRQRSSVSSSVPFSLSMVSEISISPSTTAYVQPSSHMTSAVFSSVSSLSTQEVLPIQTSSIKQHTVSTSSDHVSPSYMTTWVLSISSSAPLEPFQSRPVQSISTFSIAVSSSFDRTAFTSSRKEQITTTAASVQSVIPTSTTTRMVYVTDHSTSLEWPSTTLLPELTSSQPSPASATPSQSTTPAFSTSPLPKQSTTHLLPTLLARNISFEVEFNGVCSPLVQRKIVLEIFWEELVITLAKALHIENSAIKPKDIACRPIRISFVIMETTRTNITQILKGLIANEELKFKIPVLVGGSESKYQYKAVSVKQVPLDYDISGTPDLYEIGLNKVDIIVIIVACCVSFILICIGCCICLREYYIRKRSRSFDLSDIVNFNLKLEDYTLTKIPRNKPFYSDNSVKMQSFTRKNGQQTKSLLEQEEQCNCDDVNVMKEVKVRMNSHSDGIVIGVTATSIPDVVTNHQRAHDDQADQSKEILFENESSPTHCMDNPIYFADDDRFTAV
ncbi:flocculation protein FLO11-like [Pecten maximus]|uniref:flocculation protein FLO11-like n=1 Tax=Pecten maximus TaxID=6579 RepID=UPI0014580A44|nr:flocculation protein FLO11-like [Pecten maximus]